MKRWFAARSDNNSRCFDGAWRHCNSHRLRSPAKHNYKCAILWLFIDINIFQSHDSAAEKHMRMGSEDGKAKNAA